MLRTAASIPATSATFVAVPASPDRPVLAVDLDGTLLRGDLLWECLLAYLRPAPWRVFQTCVWLLRGGPAALKAELAERVHLDGAILPWNSEVISFCQAKASSGTTVVLATATNQQLAESVTRQFAFLRQVFGSSEQINLKGEAKSCRLALHAGASGFDYIGDSAADVPVWKTARTALYVGNAPRRARFEKQIGRPLDALAITPSNLLTEIGAALRPHQWLKNLLIFVPIVSAHRWRDAEAWARSLPVFFALCCFASASYLVNDLADLAADRVHVRKKLRPLASGRLAIPTAIAAVMVLVGLGVAFGFSSGAAAGCASLAYFALSVSYSLKLKSLPVFEAVFLSTLYTYRMVLGGIAASILISPWLLSFSTTFFLGLALLKRFVEIDALPSESGLVVPGRGYRRTDLSFVLVAGIAANFLSVVVLALYLQSTTSRALYASPEWLWCIALVMLCWIMRVWFLAGRKRMHDDPVLFAAKDWVTLAMAVVCVAVIAAARPL